MLRETVTEWTRQWLEEGRQQGLQQGEVELLTELLEHRFGALDERHLETIRQADHERLLAWGKRVLTAQSLDEVL